MSGALTVRATQIARAQKRLARSVKQQYFSVHCAYGAGALRASRSVQAGHQPIDQRTAFYVCDTRRQVAMRSALCRKEATDRGYSITSCPTCPMNCSGVSDTASFVLSASWLRMRRLMPRWDSVLAIQMDGLILNQEQACSPKRLETAVAHANMTTSSLQEEAEPRCQRKLHKRCAGAQIWIISRTSLRCCPHEVPFSEQSLAANQYQ